MSRDDDLFADALELPASERAAFLERACPDPVQRARVAALLSGHESARDFLNRPLAPRPPEPAEQAAGDMIGRYKLVRRIGEGGCGVVWLAEQQEPLHRFVALKVIKLGMDTRNVIARFEAERQALALMTHPDIAQVFDAGTTGAGRPYFVMEYVEGVPITKFCDEQSLPLDARLELFSRVCVALQHAHQKGIIHRDLKPSNILVALRDGVPAPKIIDFGIAKATQGRLTEDTLATEFGLFMGTPAYMSPEQADLREPDVDTRSDVYSLGVLLYELLTGRPPHDPKSLVQAGLFEIRRIIREVDPPRPSTAISTLTNADRETVARLRGAAVLQLDAVLRGDLDWIVMRCLEKNRERRYGTASDLAEDVRRHLRSEPITARPPSVPYRVGKFVARNRLACLSVAAVVAALLAGTFISVRQAVRATRAERVAAAERDAATAAGRAEAVARADAQRRQEQAEDLLTFMLGDFRTELKKIGRLDLLDRVGAKAMNYFTALDPRDLTDTALTRQAKALTQIGEVRMEQTRYAEAEQAFITAHSRAATLAARHPQNGDMLFERGQAEFWIGFVARRRGDFAAERTWFSRYRDSCVELVAVEGPTERAQLEVIYGHHNLAVIEIDRGSLELAEQGFRAEGAALDILLARKPDDSQLGYNRADVASWLGSVAERSGRYADAARSYEEMGERYRALHAREPNVARWRLELAQSLVFRGRIAAITGHRDEAARLYAEARTWLDALVTQDPKNKQWLISQQGLQLQQAALLLARGDAAGAGTLVDDARHTLGGLAAAEPTSLNLQRHLASAWRFQAAVHLAHKELVEAAAAATRACEIGEALVKDARADTPVFYEFASANVLAGRIALAQSGPEAAQPSWQRASAALAERVATSRDWMLLEPAALAALASGRTDEARPYVERLQISGFRPIDPWTETVLGQAASLSPASKP
jgi:serine/threonine-protein kinase